MMHKPQQQNSSALQSTPILSCSVPRIPVGKEVQDANHSNLDNRLNLLNTKFNFQSITKYCGFKRSCIDHG